jgi:hypothetical protein
MSGCRRNPPLALDLHYLLTAYAARDLHAEILLGYAMQLLHETPVLPREGIRRALRVPGLVHDPENALPPDLEAIASSDLAEQVEAIKIVPTVQSTEEVSKLWAAFQSRYRPSAAYLASVVLIESRRSTRAALQVGRRKLYVAPFREPRIERVLAQETGSPSGPARSDMPILARHRLVLRGKQLKGERTSVRVGGVTVRPDAPSLTDTEIALDLPPGLSAGVQSVQVIHEFLMGEPETPHSGVESNLAAFVLHPEIVAAPALSQGTVRLTIDPPTGVKQQVVLLLNERSVVSSPPVELPPPRAYSFVAPRQPASSPTAPSNQIDVPIKGVASGTYLVRVQVDGAESPLGSDEKGRFDSPSLTIP